MAGILYGVSVGPGDPQLLTLKAVEIIKKCSVIATPITKGEKTLALDIAKGAVDVEGKEVILLPFKMTRDKNLLAQTHNEIASTIQQKLDQGQDVAFLNLGDISVYSTFAYIMDILVEKGYGCEMIPGVTSFCAVAATLNMGLTSMHNPLHIIPAGSPIDLEETLALKGTKVLMKTASAMPKVKQAIIDKNLQSKTKLVQNCGLPTQIICHDIATASDDISYFTTIIVKE